MLLLQDKESKHRLKAMARCNQPITAGCFNHVRPTRLSSNDDVTLAAWRWLKLSLTCLLFSVQNWRPCSMVSMLQHSEPVRRFTESNGMQDGAIYAYSTSYDWGKGHAEHNAAQAKTYIFLHGCQDSEVKGRKPTSRR